MLGAFGCRQRGNFRLFAKIGTNFYATGRAKAPLVKRAGPTVRDTHRGNIATGTQFRVKCVANGDKIRDTSVWYYLESGKWVSAAYVEEVPRDDSYWMWCN